MKTAEAAKIFINYRRQDSGGYAGRLCDRLKARFPRQVFMDVGGIKIGADFVETIEREVGSCKVCLVVIGPGWANSVDVVGRRRLDDPDDYVRMEIGTALKRDVVVIPVLVGGAAMPAEKDLPADMQPLARRNALQVTDQDWDHHVALLISTLEGVLHVSPVAPEKSAATLVKSLPRRPLPAVAILTGIIALSTALYIVLHRNGHQGSLVASGGSGRRAVAVLGFKNISGQPEMDYLSTALSEMLTTELQAGGDLRAIPQSRVSRMKQDLSLTDVLNLPPETLNRIREYSGANLLVYGSYDVRANTSGPDLHLELQMRDATGKQSPKTLSEDGSQANLFPLVSTVGKSLREKIAAAPLSENLQTAVKAALPANPEATRLYSQALGDLRAFDLTSARDRLQQAVDLDPNFALAHSELAQAYQDLGYDAKAREQAKAGFDLAFQLIPEQKELVEARYHAIYSEWDAAVKIYNSLWTVFSDVEYGLLLAQTQISAGRGADALATVASLRKLPPPSGQDPRIDYLEALAADSLSDFKKGVAATDETIQKAKTDGDRYLVAQALLEQCWAYGNLTEPAKAMKSCEEAQDAFADVGDLLGRARSLTRISMLLQFQGNINQALDMRSRALAIARQIGSKKDISGALMNIGNMQLALGDTSAAAKSYGDALTVATEIDFKKDMLDAENNLGALDESECSYEAAKAEFNQSLQTAQLAGNQFGVAGAVYNLGGVLYLLGDLQVAQSDFQRAISVGKQAGDKADTAVALFGLGDVQLARDDLAGAEKSYQSALDFIPEEDKDGRATYQLEMAVLKIEQGDAAGAVKLAQQAAAEFESEKVIGNEAAALDATSRALISLGKYAEAQQDIERAGKLPTKDCGIRMPLAITTARLLAYTKQPGAAQRAIQLVLDEARAKKLDGFMFDARLAQAEIAQLAGNSQSARTQLRDLQAQAEQRNFLLIARKARALWQDSKPAAGHAVN